MSSRISFYGRMLCAVAVCICGASLVFADSFGAGANQFDIDFVTISAASNPASGQGIVYNDYRISTCEISNGQWVMFESSLEVPVTGSPLSAYDQSARYIGADMPANGVSWYEAAQFVNWLNTSTGHHVAYNFVGTQGQSDYSLATWLVSEADNATNLYRHKHALYYLPTDDEWVKAGFWNGTILQLYATRYGEDLHQGDGITASGWNYYDEDYAIVPAGPWAVGSGSEELNGTFDMMGNSMEWTESPYTIGDYQAGSARRVRGGCHGNQDFSLTSLSMGSNYPDVEGNIISFRVASDIVPVLLPYDGDANMDGKVNLDDFIILKQNYGTGSQWSEGDFTGDGIVDLDDFILLKQNYGYDQSAS